MYFLTNQNEINSFVSSSIEYNRDESGWIINYKHPESLFIWELIVVDDRSFSYLLKRNDLPKKVDELFQKCFSSNEENDWEGLGILCSLGSYNYKEIQSFLENTNIPKNKLSIFSNAFNPIDNRNLLGMHIKDIFRTYDEYRETIEKIRNLCNQDNLDAHHCI